MDGANKWENTMRKNFGEKTWIYPMPVLILGTHDEGGTSNAMNAAWGGIYDTNMVMICLAGRRRSFSTRWIIVTAYWYSLQYDWYLIVNSLAFSGLPAAFVVLCVLTKEVRTWHGLRQKNMLRQGKWKNGDCIPGNKPGGTVSVCVTGEGVKSNE